MVDAHAAKGEAFLYAMLDQDPGAGRWAKSRSAPTTQFANLPGIPCSTKRSAARSTPPLGAAYPETGGKNQSGLHWDMVCDLRQGGKIFADGQLISENGRFLDPAWPQPSSR